MNTISRLRRSGVRVSVSHARVFSVRRFLATAVLLLIPCLLLSCAVSPAADPFTLVRGDFDAEITWELPKKDSGTTSLRDPATYTATVRFRDGLLTMAFTSPESMAGIEVSETARGTVIVRRGGKQLEGNFH